MASRASPPLCRSFGRGPRIKLAQLLGLSRTLQVLPHKGDCPKASRPSDFCQKRCTLPPTIIEVDMTYNISGWKTLFRAFPVPCLLEGGYFSASCSTTSRSLGHSHVLEPDNPMLYIFSSRGSIAFKSTSWGGSTSRSCTFGNGSDVPIAHGQNSPTPASLLIEHATSCYQVNSLQVIEGQDF